MFLADSANRNAVRKEINARVLTTDQPRARSERFDVMEFPQIEGAMIFNAVLCVITWLSQLRISLVC